MSATCVSTGLVEPFNECIGGTWHKVIKEKYDCVDENGDPFIVWRTLSSHDSGVPCNAESGPPEDDPS